MFNHVAVIELAGGKGTRFGKQKQFLEFHGKEIWRHAYEKVLNFVPKENVVVVGVDCDGGITRSQSVINGLHLLKEKNINFERLIVIEAARPLVSLEQLEKIICDKHKSSTYVQPLVSTIIKKDGTYLDRNDFWRMSSPVGFDYHLFMEAYLSGKYYDFTDDTRVMYEHYGIKPYFLEGDENLYKLTYKSDLPVLETLYDKFKDE